MKQRLQRVLVLVLSVVTLASCIKISGTSFNSYTGKHKRDIVLSGVDTTIIKKWNTYNKVEVSGDISVTYRKGSENTIVIKGDTALTSLINIEEDNDNGQKVINLHSDYNADLEDSEVPSVIITTDSITNIYLKGNSDITFEGDFHSKGLISIDCSGSPSLEGLHLQAGRLTLESSGASSFSNFNIVVDSTISIKSKGACSFDSLSIKSSDTNIEMLGASSLEAAVEVSNKLDIQSLGASSVIIKGNTNSVDCVSKGASSVDISNLNVNGSKKIKTAGVSSIKE